MSIPTFDAAKLAAIPDKLATLYLDDGRLSGFSMLVARQGEIETLACRGKSAMGAEADAAFDIAPDSIFRIYSMTKPITSLAFMQLIEAGEIGMHDPVTNYIPAFADTEVWVDGTTRDYTTRPPERDITLHDLITHQSGLTYDFMADHPVDALYRRKRLTGSRNAGISLATFVDELAQLPLLFSPGTSWNYSVGIDVIGRVIEIVSGMDLEHYFQQHIFTPLGMSDTSFNITPEQTPRLTHCYYNDSLHGKIRAIDGSADTAFLKPTEFYGGGGGLLSTITDYHRFCRMLEQKGALDGTRIISAPMVDEMMRNQLSRGGELEGFARGSFSENGFAGNGFGIGGSLILDPARALVPAAAGTYSWGGLANTYFWIDPPNALTVILMTQMMPYGCYPIRSEVQDMVYKALA